MNNQEPENLNIDWNVKRLVLLALNIKPGKAQAAQALGVTDRTLQRYIHQYAIQYNGKEYFSNSAIRAEKSCRKILH